MKKKNYLICIQNNGNCWRNSWIVISFRMNLSITLGTIDFEFDEEKKLMNNFSSTLQDVT